VPEIITIPTPGTLTVEGWTNQYLTMTDLVSLLRLRLRSPSSASSGERNRWSDTELQECIQAAVGQLAPRLRVPESLTFEFAAWERDYQVPAYVREILTVRVRGWGRTVVVPNGAVTSRAIGTRESIV